MQSTFREHSSWPCGCCSTRRPAEQLTAQVGLFLCLTSLLWVCVVSIQSQTCTSCTNSCQFAFRFPFCEQSTSQTSLHASCEQNTSHFADFLFARCNDYTCHFIFALSEQCTSQSNANSSVRITSNCVPLYMIAANSALRRALRTVRFAKLLIDFPLQFWCSFEPLHLHILLLYMMALWQVAEDLAEEVDTSALIGTGPPFTAKGLHWRLDTHTN